ncbi:hypothetical protein ACQY0O_001106 [Thecaphora frezii]
MPSATLDPSATPRGVAKGGPRSGISTANATLSGSRLSLPSGLKAADAKGASSSLTPCTKSKCSHSPGLPAHVSGQEGLPFHPWSPSAIWRELTTHNNEHSVTGQHLATLSDAHGTTSTIATPTTLTLRAPATSPIAKDDLLFLCPFLLLLQQRPRRGLRTHAL